MFEQFRDHIQKEFPFLLKSKLLIAISGGLDSVVLTHLCKELHLDIALVHCNFKLRGDESDADAEFVNSLGEQFKLQVYSEDFDVESYMEAHNSSTQMAARALRYEWFETLLDKNGFDYLLTAHHADDNLETFLINLSRGSGLTGLIGIPEINDYIVRPLLPFSRAQLADYAEGYNLEWREDSSNLKDDYLRNKLRHHVIPQLKEIAPEILNNFNKTISNLKDTADIIDKSLNAVAKRAITEIDEEKISFKVSEFRKVNNAKAYLFEMFKDYGFTEWNDVEALLTAQSGKQVFSETHRLVKDREHLILSKRISSSGNVGRQIISNEEEKIETPLGTLLFDKGNEKGSNTESEIYVDLKKISFPFELRKWEQGDLFYPFGMKGKKKLSKYFKDQKLSLIDKENIWLLTYEGKIVWVIGMRADDRFKVDDATEHVLKISLQK